MKTYRLADGDTLVVSVDQQAWETVVFEAKAFADISEATAAELIKVINKSGSLAAFATDSGELVLATATAGGHVSLEVDLAHSTSAGTLGLGGHARAAGQGLTAARLVSLLAEPFALRAGAEMNLNVDGTKRKIGFEKGITEGRATASEVVKVINARHAGVASPSRDGRVMLISRALGADSHLEVEPARADQGKIDAAAPLGFVGAAAISHPYPIAAAQLMCTGQAPGLRAVNLTSSPVELHFATGSTILPARGSVPLTPGDTTHGPLQRLIEQGVVRLVPGKGD